MPAKNLQDFMRDRMGADTDPYVNSLISSVGTTVTRLMRNNASRVAFTLYNLSTVDLYLGAWQDVSVTKGFRVGPGGGNVFFIWFEDFAILGWEWFVFATAAASNFLLVEYRIRGSAEEGPGAG